MGYIQARELLSREGRLTPQEAVDILNSWRMDADNYYFLLQTTGASVPLKQYICYADETGEYVFEKTEKRILSSAYALKFFEFESDSLTTAFLDTLDVLSYPAEEDTDITFYEWPYYNSEVAFHLSAETIIKILLNWHYVFDCDSDAFGMIYNTLYEKLSAAEECTDILAVNSFNLHDWGENNTLPVDIVAKHYHFANYSVSTGDNGGEDVYFRKCLIHYLYAYWQNLGEIVSAVLYERAKRCN